MLLPLTKPMLVTDLANERVTITHLKEPG